MVYWSKQKPITNSNNILSIYLFLWNVPWFSFMFSLPHMLYYNTLWHALSGTSWPLQVVLQLKSTITYFQKWCSLQFLISLLAFEILFFPPSSYLPKIFVPYSLQKVLCSTTVNLWDLKCSQASTLDCALHFLSYHVCC